MVHVAISAAAVALVGIFSGAWIYKEGSRPSDSDGNSNSTQIKTQSSFNRETLKNMNSNFIEHEYVLPFDLVNKADGGKTTSSLSDSHAKAFAEQNPYHTLPSDYSPPKRDNLNELRQGQWLVFVYADWCPHSRAYFPLWRVLWRTVESNPRSYAARLATVNIARDTEWASLLHTEKLPSFVLVKDGRARAKALASPTLDQLVNLSTGRWDHLGDGRAIKDRPSEILVFSLKAFDFFGNLIHTYQEIAFDWLSCHKIVAYCLIASLITFSLYLPKSSLIGYL